MQRVGLSCGWLLEHVRHRAPDSVVHGRELDETLARPVILSRGRSSILRRSFSADRSAWRRTSLERMRCARTFGRHDASDVAAVAGLRLDGARPHRAGASGRRNGEREQRYDHHREREHDGRARRAFCGLRRGGGAVDRRHRARPLHAAGQPTWPRSTAALHAIARAEARKRCASCSLCAAIEPRDAGAAGKGLQAGARNSSSPLVELVLGARRRGDRAAEGGGRRRDVRTTLRGRSLTERPARSPSGSTGGVRATLRGRSRTERPCKASSLAGDGAPPAKARGERITFP